MAKQGLDPKIVIAIVALVVLVLVVVFWEMWHASAGSAAAGGAKPGKPVAAEHGAPNADQLKKIQEWKKTHPGAYTRY